MHLFLLALCVSGFLYPRFVRVYLISRSTSPGEGIMWGMRFEKGFWYLNK